MTRDARRHTSSVVIRNWWLFLATSLCCTRLVLVAVPYYKGLCSSLKYQSYSRTCALFSQRGFKLLH
ncbi:hypothetical protein CPB83DRAFT_155115 [Crepidotus variabilis]|uniref:Uncharacterized protein n=1 Tax=Crepidotus variabilis TaxID=179855 RepID=A0A9P6EJ88_9AGAR|nr:hypothetical protein CPB83DRAFT_155115 [Crepidotus variabilis]